MHDDVEKTAPCKGKGCGTRPTLSRLKSLRQKAKTESSGAEAQLIADDSCRSWRYDPLKKTEKNAADLKIGHYTSASLRGSRPAEGSRTWETTRRRKQKPHSCGNRSGLEEEERKLRLKPKLRGGSI